MDGKSQAVLGGGAALIVVNAWTGTQRKAISNVLNNTAGSAPTAHTALAGLGGEILLVFVLAFAAQTSDAMGSAMVAALVALWILWLIQRQSTKAPAATKAA